MATTIIGTATNKINRGTSGHRHDQYDVPVANVHRVVPVSPREVVELLALFPRRTNVAMPAHVPSSPSLPALQEARTAGSATSTQRAILVSPWELVQSLSIRRNGQV
ncbi:hypothetical protein AB4Y45_45840 [Paraburkholderia sp. EG287A]|uniref:hypothetical protein n=1 Tax=Paraburkholderia sp. EG285A TaxID=3237009 RepID=UPI0034D19E2A